MARVYNMKVRMEKAYANYVKLYEAKEASLNKRGFEMAAPKLSQGAYRMVRRATVAEGVTTNINKTIVSEQAFVYNRNTALKMKAAAEKYDLSWKNISITKLMHIDGAEQEEILKSLSEMYQKRKATLEQALKDGLILPEDINKQLRVYGQQISYEVFGSE